MHIFTCYAKEKKQEKTHLDPPPLHATSDLYIGAKFMDNPKFFCSRSWADIGLDH